MHHTVEDEPGRRDQAGQLAFGAKARVVAIDRIIWIQRCSSSCSAAARPGEAQCGDVGLDAEQVAAGPQQATGVAEDRAGGRPVVYQQVAVALPSGGS